MKKLLISATALLVVAACGQEAKEPAVEEPKAEEPKALVSGIDLTGMDTSVRPGDDFFEYVNGAWVNATEMPADKSRYGLFDMLRDESQENVKAIIEKSATGDFAKGTDEQKVGDLYNSFLDWDARDARGIEPLQPELDLKDAVSDYDEHAVYFANRMTRGFDAPFGAQQLTDFLDPNYYAILIAQSGLGLPDREYYFKEGCHILESWNDPADPDAVESQPLHGTIADDLVLPQEYAIDYVRVYQAPDTAERFEAAFVDDVAGWRQVTVPFTDLVRSAYQPDGAPNDGLNLTEAEPNATAGSAGMRVYDPGEQERFDTAARGYLLHLEQVGILPPAQRELVIDRLLALESDEIDLEQIKWVVMMVLFSQPGNEQAYAQMEDLVFAEEPGWMH